MRAVSIYENAAYADAQGGPDIGGQVELITDPSYFIACRL